MPGGNSAYSPLPQSNSDSDGSSEEELRVPQEHRIVNRTGKTQNSKTEKTYNGQKPNVINYKPLDGDGDVGVTLIKFQPSSDEVSILKPSSNSGGFSTSRKIYFVISLLLCILTTVVFIWILPCNVESCPNASDKNGNNYSWEEMFPGLEFYGPISLVPDYLGRNESLLFQVRTPLGSAKRNQSQNVLLCLHGRNGSLSWNITLDKEPTEVDCKLIDMNGDGLNDCLVYEKNFLKSIVPTTGKELWDINVSTKDKIQQLQVLDFPLVVSDLNGDNTKDLLVLCSVADHSGISFHNYLVIISGRTGEVIDKPVEIKSCSVVYNLMYENSSAISYTCYNLSKKESLQTVNLTNMYNITRNVSVEKLNQHKRSSDALRLNGLKLTLDNQGSCPEDCIVLVEIKDERSERKNKTVYSFKNKNTFGMAPVPIKSQQEFGFVLKFWEWHSKRQSSFEEFPTLRASAAKKSRRSKLSNSSSLEKQMLSEGSQKFSRYKRTALASLRGKHSGKDWTNATRLNLHLINETVIKVTFSFNDSHVRVRKIAETDIIQTCRKPLLCQPDVLQQKYSMLACDLDRDGSQELVTFDSKYVHEGTAAGDDSWSLRSRVQVMNF